MKICADCFNDEELRGFIDSNGAMGVCDILKRDAKIIDIAELADFFTDLFDIFNYDDTSQDSVVDIIQRDWNLFITNDAATMILEEAKNRFRPGLIINSVTYIKPISDYVGVWTKLKHDLQFRTRYLINLQHYNQTDPYFQEILKVDDYLNSGVELYRARVLPDLISNYDVNQMGCPPPKQVGGGRANPIGIPYLYLCNDRDTTFYEVRARYKDRVSVGTFKVIQNMNIINLTKKASLFLSSSEGNFRNDVKYKLLLNAIAVDMSKPLSRYDTELEYVPTQFICELCKFDGADGICFNSSLHRSGMNYVLFCGNDDTKIKCISVDTLMIEHVEISA